MIQPNLMAGEGAFQIGGKSGASRAERCGVEGRALFAGLRSRRLVQPPQDKIYLAGN